MNKNMLFNNDWEFTKQGIGSNLHNVMPSDIIWQKVDIPHDWVIHDTSLFNESCEGWYRKHFDLLQFLNSDKNIWTDERFLLRFEGVYMECTIYVNGSKVGDWKYGYTTFEIDITDCLVEGDNEILVRVVLQVPNSRWYTGGGIYRNIWLTRVPRVHIASNGVYISTKKVDNLWKIEIECEIVTEDNQLFQGIPKKNQHEMVEKDKFTLKHTVYDSCGKVITCTENNASSLELTITNPQLWNIEEPNLYYLKTELLCNGQLHDEVMNQFGFRTIRFDADSGFYLNELHIKIHGVCQHHDLGALGSAVNRCALKRQLTLLKEMGANAIRTAHNMCAIELLELADEMGLLVVSEAFDMWEKSKNTYDYARYFNDWSERDIASWIRRDRNHPCIIMWSIGNEIYDTHAGERGLELTKQLINLVYNHDPKHNAFVTIGSNYIPWENTQKCADLIKLVGYNYGEKYYRTHHNLHKDWIIYGSETGSVVSSRGIYHFPSNAQILCDDDQQCSSLGNSITSWGARSTEKCIIDDRDAVFSAGMFIWSGFDYIGEPTPYHTKNSYFGQLDTAGFKKDSYYVYQSAWTDYQIAPMVHLYPYWDFNDGQMIHVFVCSNAPKVELFFNDCSQGTFEIDHKNGQKLIGDWIIPYQKGELRAVAYDSNDLVIAEDIKKSYSDPVKLILIPDKQQLKADGQDLIFVEISAQDENGNPVHNANNRIDVHVFGAGRLIGLDNGDSTDNDSYKGTSRRLFSGKLLAIIAAKITPGEIHMEVSSQGLPSAQMTFMAEPCHVLEGVSAIQQNIESSSRSDIPIRKIEIVSPQGNALNNHLREVCVEVMIYPEDATYHDIAWRVANAAGVDSNIAKIIPDGNKATVQAIGDGTFYVRATTNNGANIPSLISIMDFHISGLGRAFYDPYEFISGSLYSRSIGEISSGNERGVATSRDGESIVIYDNLDFGSIGSDEITIPIFELESSPTRLEIWEGVPQEDGNLLADVIYHKQSIWNTYQEENYHLKKRLIGITSLSFLLKSKIHLKGFTFKKSEKAYEQLSVLSYSSLYGDDYKIENDCISNIGNNVTITFDEMDFGCKGIHRLILCGRCSINNSIVVCFKSEREEVKQLVEFSHTTEFIEREFKLNSVLGLQTVIFLFLPGCKFDMKWFRFDC